MYTSIDDDGPADVLPAELGLRRANDAANEENQCVGQTAMSIELMIDRMIVRRACVRVSCVRVYVRACI